MPAPANTDEFLDFIRKSGVAEETRLKSSLQRMAEQSGIPADPSELAKLLMRDGVLTFFQADQLLQGKWKRFFIGKYKVLERLGSGGMGQVFLCEHKLMRRRVALKVLPAAKAEDQAALDRFYREARAVAALDHPNIVRAYDIDQDEKLHFLVMEYVDGTNLQDLVKKHGVLDPLRACHYMYGSAVGLQHAHEMGLVHRDIKPGNILIDRTGVVKILDMGLARFFNDEDDQLTRNNDENILGTADYLAPEQAIDSHSVDIKADIYSLGATFYYLLTGQPPFPEGTVAQKLLWHQTREPAPIRSLRPEVPQPIVDVITKMMMKDLKQRYQTPGEVMTALAAWVQTPIPPPTDKEMPTLSPALMTGMTGPMTARLPSGAPSGIPGPLLQRGQGQSTPSASFQALGAGSLPQPVVVSPNTNTPVALAPPVPAPVVVPPQAPPVQAAVQPPANDLWQSIADELQVVSAPSTIQASAEQTARNPQPKPSAGRRWLLISGLLGLFLLVMFGTGAAAAYYFFIYAKSGQTEAAKTWYVLANPKSSPNPARTLTTLRGAIDMAGADEVIQILEPRLEEPPFRLADSAGKKKGLRIEAATPNKQVIWAPKQALQTGARSVLELVDVENLKISGFLFELNSSIENGVTVAGSCHGTTLDDLTIKNTRVTGIRLNSAVGDPNRPLKIQNCKIISEGKQEAGIQIMSLARNVQLLGNSLSVPGGVGVKIEGQVRDVELKNSRIFNVNLGLSISGKPAPDAAFTLTVQNNTFHTVATAAISCDLPFKEPKQVVQIQQNYFYATKAILTAQPAAGGLKFVANSRDATSPEGQPNSQASESDASFITTAISDAKFLQPAAGTLFHPSGVPVGAQ